MSWMVCSTPSKCAVRIHEAGEADEDRRESDQAVQDGDELGHLGHLHAAREDEADAAADQQRQHQLDIVLRDDAEDGREQRDRHTDDAVPVAASCGLLVRQSAQREDEQNRRGDVGNGNDTCTNHVDLTS